MNANEDMAVRELTRRLSTQLAEVSAGLEAIVRLTDAKFVTFRALLDSQAERVALALTSSDKVRDQTRTETERRFADQHDIYAARDAVTKMYERLEALDRVVEAQLVTLRQAIDAGEVKAALALTAADKAVNAALISHDKAVVAALTTAQRATERSELVDERRVAVVVQLQDGLTAAQKELQRNAERVEALDRITDAKFVTFRALIDSQAEKVALALAASDKAVSKAEVTTEKRFESVNEFRGQLDDQAKTFISRVEFNALRDGQIERINEIVSRLDRNEGRGAGLNAGWVYLLAALGALGTLISVFIAVGR